MKSFPCLHIVMPLFTDVQCPKSSQSFSENSCFASLWETKSLFGRNFSHRILILCNFKQWIPIWILIKFRKDKIWFSNFLFQFGFQKEIFRFGKLYSLSNLQPFHFFFFSKQDFCLSHQNFCEIEIACNYNLGNSIPAAQICFGPPIKV